MLSEAAETLLPTFVAILLGALVGLERQVAEGEREGEKDFPGVRTFAFTALLGALGMLLAAHLGPWIAVALFLATVAFLVLRYRRDVVELEDVGYTTEIAGMCTFAVGALAQADQLLVATVVTIAMVVLLRSKRTLHRAADLLSPQDMEILLRFLVITGIVFPLLPEEPLPLLGGVLVPRDVWRMVVLISAVSFVGYTLMRFRVGAGGFALTGILAGLVSSTAAALAYGRSAASSAAPSRFESLIALAAATSMLRMMLLLGIAAPVLLPGVAAPLAGMAAVGLGLAYLRHGAAGSSDGVPEFDNPLTLRVALSFAAIYASVLVVVDFANARFAQGATYLLAALAAVPGADAPMLSLARLASGERLSLETARAGIVVVAIATTLAKLGFLLTVAPRGLVLRLAPTLLAVAAAGALGLLFV